jgi:hypothetical protein
MTDGAIKPLPETVMVSGALSATAEFGVTAVTDGSGFPTVKVTVVDVPPPGAGFCTEMLAVPTALRSDAETCAVSEVLDTKLVVRAASFQWITDAAMKPEPDTVTVSLGLPTVTEFGVTVVIEGTGFCGGEIFWDPPAPPQPSAMLRSSKSKSTGIGRHEGRHESRRIDI